MKTGNRFTKRCENKDISQSSRVIHFLQCIGFLLLFVDVDPCGVSLRMGVAQQLGRTEDGCQDRNDR